MMKPLESIDLKERFFLVDKVISLGVLLYQDLFFSLVLIVLSCRSVVCERESAIRDKKKNSRKGEKNLFFSLLALFFALSVFVVFFLLRLLFLFPLSPLPQN